MKCEYEAKESAAAHLTQLLLMLTPHALVAGHLFMHDVGVLVVLLLPRHDRRRPDRGKVVCANRLVVARGTDRRNRMLQRQNIRLCAKKQAEVQDGNEEIDVPGCSWAEERERDS